MNAAFRRMTLLLALTAPGLCSRTVVAADGESMVTAVVSASVDKTYHRTKKRDGSYRTEYYALSIGGQAKGTVSDPTIDRMPRADFERLIKEHLAKQNYVMASNSASAGLLIHVLWGMTDPPTDGANLKISRDAAANSLETFRTEGAEQLRRNSNATGSILTPEQIIAAAEAEDALMSMFMLDRDRARSLAPSASVLGYLDSVNDLTDSPAIHAGLGTVYRDMLDEISENRYYVLIYAYDFDLLQKQKRLKPLWVTRVNIRAKGNQFDKHISAMLARASRHFGRATRGLERAIEGRVEIGEAEVLGVVEEHREKPATPQSPPADPRRTPSSGPTDASQPPKQQR